MKTSYVAALALLSTSFLTTPALADTVAPPTAAAADATTLAAMQDQCNTLAATHDINNGDIWSADVVEGASTLFTGPNEIFGSRAIDQISIVGTGTYVPGAREIRGVPFKNGGSVNMFGDQWSTAGYYPDSTYNFTADFASAFLHGFSCNINDAVYHAAVIHPAVHHDRVGHWVVNPDAHGNEEANTNNCNAFNSSLPGGPANGSATDQANCTYIVDQEAYDEPEVNDPEYNDPPVFVVNQAGIAVHQNQTDNLSGFEDHGGIVQVTGEYHIGQPVICISPGSKGGSWRVQNGYGGGSLTGPAAGCNTPYFKVAPWGNGSQTSNGTFTSVPHYNL